MRRIAPMVLLTLALPACDKGGETDEPKKPTPATTASAAEEPKAKATATASASAAPTEDKPGQADAKVEAGETVTVKSGQLKSGSRCVDVPRIRPHELEMEVVNMGDFDIDKYPYPNKAGEEAVLGLNHDEAKAKCEERGRRLCTEMEWERACKGPKNTTYPWGNGFKRGQCPGQKDHKTGARDKCVTKFGVQDMVGVALEWTASDWKRGTGTGDKVVHGARAEMVSWLSARCTHSRKRNPHKGYDNVGFRCCGGTANSAEVDLRPRKQTTLVERHPDTPFQMEMLKRLKRDFRQIVDVEISIDPIYKWHPVAGEEMILARWHAEPKDGSKPYSMMVAYKMCGDRAWKSGMMRGPVEKLSKPKVGKKDTYISFDVQTGSDRGTVTFKYWHGTVKVIQPKWIKSTNRLGGEAGDDEGKKKVDPDKAFKKPLKFRKSK